MTCRVARSFVNETQIVAPVTQLPDGLLEGPSADSSQKGGGPMDFLSLYFSKEIQDYLHSCENLLAALSTPSTASRVSMEEREMLRYSVAELQKLLVVWDDHQ
jgi:hypothetical protein